MNDEPTKKLPIEPGRNIKTNQEKLLESREGKLERLKDLTGIETEEELVDIYIELLEVIRKINVDNISYEANDIGLLRGTSEKQFVFRNLNDEELKELESVLRKISIFGFPEPAEHTNQINLFIENKKNLEILRLITVSDFIRKEKDKSAYIKRVAEQERQWAERRKANERRQRDIARQIVDNAMEDWKKRLDKRVQEYDKEEERKARIRMENALSERLRENKVDLVVDGKKTEEEIRKEQLKLERDQRYEEILKVLEKIEPQKIDITEEMLDSENDPFNEISGYRGYLKREFPSKGKRRNKDEFDEKHVEEFDPEEIDQEMQKFTEAWNSGQIVEEINSLLEEKKYKQPKPIANTIIFPTLYKWVFDDVKKRNRIYEYDKNTKKLGKEITRHEIEDEFQHLKVLRAERVAREKELKLDPKNAPPKSKEETNSELKIILFYKNLILWLIKDLTNNHIKGNLHLRSSDPDDLFQVCIMGLFYAVDHSAVEKRNAATSTSYVLACMEGFLRTSSTRSRNFQIQQVRSPEHIVDKRRKISKVIRLLEREFPKQKVTDEMIVEALSKPDIDILRIEPDEFEKLNSEKERRDLLIGKYKALRIKLLLDYSEVAYEAIYDETKDVDTRVDMLARELHVKNLAEENIFSAQLKKYISEVLRTLTPREERVLRLRFGLEQKEIQKQKEFGEHPATGQGLLLDGLTLDEVGIKFSVTRERIRQIEAKALRKLKHPSRTKKLRSFLDY